MAGRSHVAMMAQRWYRDGENVTARAQAAFPSIPLQQLIEVAYDQQSGTYTELLDQPSIVEHKEAWGKRVAQILAQIGARTACEAGTGEATTLAFIAQSAPAVSFSGFDISLSRLLYAQRLLKRLHLSVDLFSADLLNIPLPDGAVDVMLTNHSLEPNGGLEEQILRELLRVSGRYLILIEPDFERATAEQQERMTKHRYVRGLASALGRMDCELIRYEPWPHNLNPLNAASLFVVRKPPLAGTLTYVSPVNKRPLEMVNGFFYCREEGLLYPRFSDIPILREETALVCSHAEMARREL